MPNIAILYKTSDKTPMIVEEKHLDLLRSHNPDGEIRVFETEEEILAADFDAEILIAWGGLTPNTYCNRCTNLRWIQSISAGVEGVQALDVVKNNPGFLLTKMAGIHSVPMSEHTMWFILSFLRGTLQMRRRQLAHIWKKPDNPAPTECQEKVVSIIGIGAIGQEVARKCKLFGMKVVGCRRHPSPMEWVDEMHSTAELDTVLAMSDFVVCLVPHSPQSEGMFGTHQFEVMKASAVFINIGRGAVVDTDALVRALQNGIIAGAALDAVAPEPLPENHPLWGMENVIISPHCAADSPYYFDRAFPLICENLDRYLRGEELSFRM